MYTHPYQALASLMFAYDACRERGATEWAMKHMQAGKAIVFDYLPGGGGFNYPIHLSWAQSTPDKLIFMLEYDVMDEQGFYTHVDTLMVTVTPSLALGINVEAESACEDEELAEYIADQFYNTLMLVCDNDELVEVIVDSYGGENDD